MRVPIFPMKTVTPSKNRRSSTMTHGRQYAISVDGCVVTYECERAGHVYRVNFGSRRLPVSRRMGESGCRFMARWHNREHGGCIGQCPECK